MSAILNITELADILDSASAERMCTYSLKLDWTHQDTCTFTSNSHSEKSIEVGDLVHDYVKNRITFETLVDQLSERISEREHELEIIYSV